MATDHVDIAFMFFVLAAVWCSVESTGRTTMKWAALSGICIGAAVLTKWLPALVVLPVTFFILKGRGTSVKVITAFLGVQVVLAAIVAVPWQLYIMHRFPAEAMWEYHFNSLHVTHVMGNQGGNFFYHFDMLRINFGELIYLPVLWFTWITIKGRNSYGMAILAWFWIPYLFFSFCATKMQAYTLFAAPAVFITTAHIFGKLAELAKQASALRRVFVVVAFALIALPVRYSIERIKPFSKTDQHPAWLEAIGKFKNSVHNNPKTVVVNCSHPIEMMFETDCICYPGFGALPPAQGEMGLIADSVNHELLPEKSMIEYLHSMGYSVMKETGNRFTDTLDAGRVH